MKRGKTLLLIGTLILALIVPASALYAAELTPQEFDSGLYEDFGFGWTEPEPPEGGPRTRNLIQLSATDFMGQPGWQPGHFRFTTSAPVAVNGVTLETLGGYVTDPFTTDSDIWEEINNKLITARDVVLHNTGSQIKAEIGQVVHEGFQNEITNENLTDLHIEAIRGLEDVSAPRSIEVRTWQPLGGAWVYEQYANTGGGGGDPGDPPPPDPTIIYNAETRNNTDRVRTMSSLQVVDKLILQENGLTIDDDLSVLRPDILTAGQYYFDPTREKGLAEDPGAGYWGVGTKALLDAGFDSVAGGADVMHNANGNVGSTLMRDSLVLNPTEESQLFDTFQVRLYEGDSDFVVDLGVYHGVAGQYRISFLKNGLTTQDFIDATQTLSFWDYAVHDTQPFGMYADIRSWDEHQGWYTTAYYTGLAGNTGNVLASWLDVNNVSGAGNAAYGHDNYNWGYVFTPINVGNNGNSERYSHGVMIATAGITIIPNPEFPAGALTPLMIALGAGVLLIRRKLAVKKTK